MKKKAIFTIVACSISALLLIGILAVGLSADGFGLGTLMREAEAGWKPLSGHRYESTWDPAEDEVTGLDVNWINGRVELKPASGSEIRIVESADRELDEAHRLKLTYSGGILKVDWGQNWIILGIFENQRKDLVIEVPHAVAGELERLSCETTSGPITVSGFTAGKQEFSSTSGALELSGLKGETISTSTTSGSITLDKGDFSESLSADTVSGGVKLSDIKTETASLNTVSGALSLEGRVEKLNTNGISGAVSASLSRCPDSVDMDSVSGSLTLYLPENDGFEVDFSSVSGNFTSEFPTTGGTGKSGRAMYSSGKSSFSFSTTSGDMRVKKLEA